MNIFGQGLLYFTALSSITTIVFYWLSAFKSNKYESSAKSSLYLFAVVTLMTSLYFLTQILSHNFAIEYVYGYSSVNLNFFLLLSTFWAGQVGTFLLWLLITAIICIILMRSTWEHKNRLIFFYLLTALFLVVLLLAKSPFTLLDWQAMGLTPEQFPPQDGRGLNPLLQNFWMIIHPPIVFWGYALIAVPFAYALTALSSKDYSQWSKQVFPWTLLSSAILGLGIFLGGYWAYETLGWGGYWAWDPVENSSLIPWLTNLALVHGLIIEKTGGGLRKTNLFLALVGYVLVLYGTFLTRSGILQEFSVHSFTDLGLNAYLIMGMLALTLFAFVLYLIRLNTIPDQQSSEKNQNIKETFMILGALFVLLLAVLTWVGTSWPVITTIIGQSSDVTQSFYNSIVLPIGIIIAVLISITSVYYHLAGKKSTPLRYIFISGLVGIIAAAAAFLLKVNNVQYLILILVSVSAIMVNLLIIFSRPQKTLRAIAGNLSHIGFGIIVIGFIASSGLSQSSGVVKIKAGEETQVMDMNCRFNGIGENFFNKDNPLYIEVKDKQNNYLVTPRYYQDMYTGQIMINPYIRKTLFDDIYFAPQRYIPNYSTLILAKGESNTAFGYTIKFNDFISGDHVQGEGMQFGADLEVTVEDSLYHVIPYYVMGMTDTAVDPYAMIPNTSFKIYIAEIMADEGKVMIDIVGIGDLVMEVARKPLINLVWLGAILIVFGSIIGYYKRRKAAL